MKLAKEGLVNRPLSTVNSFASSRPLVGIEKAAATRRRHGLDRFTHADQFAPHGKGT